MAKTKKEKEDASKIRCPVCNAVFFDFDEEDSFQGLCEHVVLTYSTLDQNFGELNGPGYDLAEEMEEKVKENDKHEDEDGYEPIYIEELIRDLAYDPESKYQLIEVSDEGLACGPISDTLYLLIEIPQQQKQNVKHPKKSQKNSNKTIK